MSETKQSRFSNYKSHKQFLRRKISELTFSEDWDKDPEILEQVRRLSRALERVGSQEKYLSGNLLVYTTEKLNVDNYIQLKKQGYLDREIKHIFNITAYALARWKKSLGLTQDVIRELVEAR